MSIEAGLALIWFLLQIVKHTCNLNGWYTDGTDRATRHYHASYHANSLIKPGCQVICHPPFEQIPVELVSCRCQGIIHGSKQLTSSKGEICLGRGAYNFKRPIFSTKIFISPPPKKNKSAPPPQYSNGGPLSISDQYTLTRIKVQQVLKCVKSILLMWKRLVLPARWWYIEYKKSACFSFRMLERSCLWQRRLFMFLRYYVSREVSCGMLTKVCRARRNYLKLSCFLHYPLTACSHILIGCSHGGKVTFGNMLCTFNVRLVYYTWFLPILVPLFCIHPDICTSSTCKWHGPSLS